jgi:hypothetical protein
LELPFLLFDILLASEYVGALVMVNESGLYVLVEGVGNQAAVGVGLKEVVDPATCSPYLGLPS